MKAKQNSIVKIHSIRRLLKNAIIQKKSVYLWCAIFTVVAVIVPFLPIALPKLLISELMSQSPSAENVLYVVGAFFVIAAVLNYAKTLVNGIAYPKITTLRIDYVRDQAVKVLKMDYKYIEDSQFFDQYEKGFQSCSGNNNGVEGVYHKLFEIPTLILTIVGLAFFVGTRSVWILLALAVNIVATVLCSVASKNYAYKNRQELMHKQRKVGYYTNTAQDFAYGKDTRLYNLKERILDNFNIEISGYISVWTMLKNREFALGFIALFTLLASDAVTYGLLVMYTINGMSIADFSMYLVAIATLSLQLTTLSESLTFIYNEKLYIDDFYRFMDAPLGTDGGTKNRIDITETLDIEFKDVSFKYPRTDRYIFKNLNLHIPKGQRLAIVGVNGAGKTTLIKLLTGLFEVDSGQILINGINVNDYKKSELYAMFCVVFQDVNILAFTIAENIACSSDHIDEDRLNAVIKKAGLSDKINSLPNGTKQIMLKIIDSDGTEFSGGENQKLSIARALYKDGNMVIMDEPTAALDALAEAEIYADFADLVQGKTAIYISHRLASTKFCDQIALFDGNGLTEYGTHDELMALGGEYCNMFTVQGKYYREKKEENA